MWPTENFELRMKLDKAWNLWRYYNLREFAGKAWEKYIVDRKRFGGVVSFASDISTAKCAQLRCKQVDVPAGAGPAVCFLVHFFYPDKTGGTERFVFNLAKAKLARGGRVRVITLSVGSVGHYPNRTGNILWRDYDYDGVPVTEYRYKKTPCGIYYKRMEEDPELEKFARMILERESFDVIHCAFPQPFTGFLKTSMQMNIPYIITNTGFGVFCHYTTLIDRNGQLCLGSEQGRRCAKICPTYGIADYQKRFQTSKELLCHAEAVTAPSYYVANRLEVEYPGLPVLVVPHGIDKKFSPQTRTWKGNRFAFVGTFTRLKGIHVLITAFKSIEGEFVLDLYGAGDADYEKELKRLASGDSRIAFCGFVGPEDVVQVYCQHDVIVVPSLVPETYCFVLREALNCGCAVVASDIGAMTEVVSSGNNGYLVPPGDEIALRDAMVYAGAMDMREHAPIKFPDVAYESSIYENLYRKIVDNKI